MEPGINIHRSQHYLLFECTMKKLLAILIFGIPLLRCSAQFIPTNEVDGVMNSSSYGTFNYILWERYFWSYFADMYPQWTNQIYDVGEGGNNWQADWQSNWGKRTIPYLLTLTNSGNFSFWILPNDNGGYFSNDIIEWGTNFMSAPPFFYNGTAVTNEGIFHGLNYNHYFTGTIPSDTSGGLNSHNISIESGSLVLNSLSSTLQFDLLYELNNNGWSNDITGARLLGFYTGGHPYPAGHLAMTLFTLLNQNCETNISSVTFNWQAATASTNHCSVSGVSLTSNVLSGTIHFDRMGPGWDWAHDSYTNDAPPLFTVMPFMANSFNQIIQATNLPVGNYSLVMDGALIFNSTSVQLASGVNIFTNKNGWLGAQQQAVLDAIADVYGADHVGLSPTHDAGSVGAHGNWDDINLRSEEDGAYEAGFRGTNILVQVKPFALSMGTNSVFVHAAAQQTNHTFSLQLISGNPAPFR